MAVQPVGPLPDAPDVKGERVVHLRGRADREGVPLEPRHGRYLDEDPVAGAEVEAGRSLDDQVRDARRKDDAGADDSLSPSQEAAQDPVGQLDDKDAGRPDEPLPELGGVDEEEAPVEKVQHVGHVEHLEVAAPADERHRAHDHDDHDDHEGDARRVGNAARHAKDARHRRHYPVHVAPLLGPHLGVAGLAVVQGDVDGHAVGDGEGAGLAVLGHLRARLGQVAAGWQLVAQHGPVGHIVFPIRGSQLDKLDRVRLNVDS